MITNTTELRVVAMAIANATWRNRVLSAILPEDFQVGELSFVVKTIGDLKAEGLYSKENLTSRLKSALEASKISAPTVSYLLGDKSFSTSEFDHDFGILSQRVCTAKLTQTLSNALMAVSEAKIPAKEIAAKTVTALHKATNATNTQPGFESVGEAAARIIEGIEAGYAGGTAMQVWRPASDNIPASFVELVANTGELYMNEVTILAARPAMGKTAMAISMAENLVFNGTPVLFCSLEMTTERVTMRLLSSMTGIAIESIKSGHLSDIEKGRLRHAGTILGTMDNFYITGMASPSCGELEARIEEKVEEVGQCMVIIDYFGLIKTETSDWKEKDSVAFNLQSLTKRLPIGMILLAQLSRNVETRGGSKRPQMSDLRETGALEMIADKIFFLYRPEYYGILEDENNNTTKGITELIVAKARDNALVTVSMRFIPSAMRFVDIPGGTKTGAVSSAPTKKPRPAYAVAPTPKAMPLSVTDEPSVPFRPINTDDLPF